MWSFFKKVSLKRQSSNIMYLQVPMVCNTRKDKNLLIEETIKHLERNIKIKQ
jgi:hypothetical protein